MIKRLLFIAFILGLGQVFIIYALKNISQLLSPERFALFGQVESNFQFLIILIAAGILSDAIRRIAQTNDWEKEYVNYQSARIFFSFLITPLALLCFIDKSYIIFLIAPVIGLSGEYAFYGVGKPIQGAIIAFVRIIVPYGISILVARLAPQYFLELFIMLLVVTYFFTGYIIAGILNTRFFIKPSINHFRLYFTSFKLGIINISIYIQGLGLLLLIPLLFKDDFLMISAAFLSLKFYAIYKSVIRIIHQALVREMLHLKHCLTVDKLTMLLGFTFLAAVLIFPKSAITLLFGDQYLIATPLIQLIGLTCVIFSICFSLGTNAILINFENRLLFICLLSVGLCVLSLFLYSLLLPGFYAIGLALLTGEVSLAAGLLYMYQQHKIIPPRLFSVLQNSLCLGIPLLFKTIFLSDSLQGMLLSVGCYSLVIFLLNLKEFNAVTLTKTQY
ncbi:MAG TPA: hypothetical protein VFV46_04790 [Lacibacter sp.]|nr:hypothetical protein [Lacibacter sp.]